MQLPVVVAPLKALVVVAMGSSPNMVDDFVAAAVAGLPKSTARVFPLPLQPLPSWAVVPRSRREQLRHKARVRLVTLLNLVLTSLNAMASTVSQVGVVLHAPLMSSWTSSPHSVSSSYSSSSVFVPCVSSSLQHSILLSVFQRVRSFDLSVRRRGESVVSQSNSAEHSLIGLCDSLTQWLAALFTSLSPLSMSVDPSVVFSAFPFSASSTFSLLRLHATLKHLPSSFDYLRDAVLRDRAVPIVAHRMALPSQLTPVKLLSCLPVDQAAFYGAPSDTLLLPQPRKVNRAPRIFGSHSEYVKLVSRLLSIGMVSLTSHPKVINGVFAVPKDTEQDRLIIDAVFANAWFTIPPKVKLP